MQTLQILGNPLQEGPKVDVTFRLLSTFLMAKYTASVSAMHARLDIQHSLADDSTLLQTL